MRHSILTRAFALLLVLTLLCTAAPRLAFFAGAKSYSGECGEEGDNLTWGFDPGTGVLTIEGSGDMENYGYEYSAPWSSYAAEITALSLPEGLTSIGSFAFEGTWQLNEISIPETVCRIGEDAFHGSGLTSVTIPEAMTEIADETFFECGLLTTAEIPETVTYIGDSAFALTSLSSIQIPEGVTGLGTMAFGCIGSVTSVTIPASVDYIAAAPFCGCSDLVEVLVDPGNSDFYSDECGVLYNADKTILIQYPNGRTGDYVVPEGVDTIGYRAFESCDTRLTGVTFPDSLTLIESRAFMGCTGLTSVVLPEQVIHVYEDAFWCCFGLETVTFLNPLCNIDMSCLDDCGDVTIYGYSGSSAESFAENCGYPFVSLGEAVFAGACGDALTWTFDSDTGVLAIEGQGDMWDFWSEDGEFVEIPWLPIAGRITELRLAEGMTSIGEHAFMDCTALTSVTIPGTVTAIRDRAFANCYNLTSAELPEGITYLSGFAYCYNLSEVKIPSTVTVLGYKAFCCCESLTEIKLPAGLTHIYWAAFRDCCGLTEVKLPDSLVYVDTEAFGRCTGLTEMTFPASVSYVGDYALEDCTNLASVTFLNPICEIDYECLEYNTWATIYGYSGSTAESYAEDYGNPFVSLGTVELGGPCGDDLTWTYDPETRILSIQGSGAMWDFGYYDEYFSDVETPRYAPWRSYCGRFTGVKVNEGVTSIGRSAFSGCPVLTDVDLAGTVTSIGPFAFEECTALTEVTIPGSVKSIGSYAFEYCCDLRTVKLQEGVESIGANAFFDCSSLTSVSFPESLASIGVDAFQYCTALRQLVFRNPDCKIGAYQKWTTRGSWFVEYDAAETLGLPETTSIFGLHDAEREDAEMMQEQVLTEWDSILTGYRYVENYAKQFGYAFYALGTFSDVAAGKWYEIPVAWASGKGITSGTGNGKFSPERTCTREQVVTFLWKAMGSPEPETTGNPFPRDVDPTQYYYKAVLWAKENGVTGGVGKNKFGVGQACTREQVVTFLWKAMGAPEPETAVNPFKDVAADTYYCKAVLWAVENGVTSGVSKTKFGVGQPCTRGQIVTFLYQACDNVE